jgi:hypothetical protein
MLELFRQCGMFGLFEVTSLVVEDHYHISIHHDQIHKFSNRYIKSYFQASNAGLVKKFLLKK